MSEYYDWHKTLTYDADVTMVIGHRGIGKTYGLRKQCIRDHIKNGWRFVEIVRYKKELSQVADGYFDRLARDPEFDGYVFKTDTRYMYIAKDVNGQKDENGHELKPQWQTMGYFVALTDRQLAKKRTYDNVRRLIFDEAVLEKSDRYHSYLPAEFSALANVVDSCSRERAESTLRPRVYLLGNACDITNPYFARYKVGTDIRHGYRWYDNKTFLLHYVQADEYAAEKGAKTVAGRMLSGSTEGAISVSNEFQTTSDEFVRRKPKSAKFAYGIVCNGKGYGIWVDHMQGFVHVTESIPRNSERVYTLTMSDARTNYMMANRLSQTMQSLQKYYWMGIVFYEDAQTKVDFQEVLNLFGVR